MKRDTFIVFMIRDKGVLVKRRRVLLRITPGCFPDVIWIAIFLYYLFIEEQAEPQGHAQK